MSGRRDGVRKRAASLGSRAGPGRPRTKHNHHGPPCRSPPAWLSPGSPSFWRRRHSPPFSGSCPLADHQGRNWHLLASRTWESSPYPTLPVRSSGQGSHNSQGTVLTPLSAQPHPPILKHFLRARRKAGCGQQQELAPGTGCSSLKRADITAGAGPGPGKRRERREPEGVLMSGQARRPPSNEKGNRARSLRVGYGARVAGAGGREAEWGEAGGKMSGSGVRTPGAGLQRAPRSLGARRGWTATGTVDYWCAV